jgi:hypothetical protein
MVAATDNADGCTAKRCGDQRTVQLHPNLGRRCSVHATVPPGPFRADFAADMVDAGRADAAFAYLAAYLARTADERFGGRIRALAPVSVGRLTAGSLVADIVLGSVP